MATTNEPLGERAAEFERHRAHLMAVAYRMLGTLADAEDAVQETYLRFAAVDEHEVHRVRGWLTRVVARICLDELGSARARREHYVGQWLPEPIVRADLQLVVSPVGPEPEDQVTLDESVSLALLVLLESLSPAERTAFVLHEVLGLSYQEVSAVVGRAEAACRQLVARARAHVHQGGPRFSPDRAQHQRAIDAFASACAHGRFDELIATLDPGVVLRADGGGRVPGVARRPIRGADHVARFLGGLASKHTVALRPRIINGSAGLVLVTDDVVRGVMGFSVSGGRITEIDFVLNPEKLRHVDP